ncbi:DeoR/GlpR family DNA-binding transcription regulator [Pseudoroseicyclus sp. CXY001]|uniref:DeoR/GlpR family DNA-binding transcription regulator n=1 Tax=Pseudoroseicyclus sp. CXY001 TaxID=3242492 RepID=UPI003570D906
MHVSPPDARREAIATRLSAGSPVSSAALAAEYRVSEDAIRRDLRALAAAGRCTRVYGGALPLSPAGRPLATRQTEDLAAKRALAEVAARLASPGQTLFLDTGSTVAILAPLLPAGVTIFTNSLPAAAALSGRTDLRLHLIGGRVSAETGGTTGAAAIREARSLRPDLAFLGACALSAEGIAAFDPEDAELKRALIASARATALMMTSAKLETHAPHPVAPLTALTHLILEQGAPGYDGPALHRPPKDPS